MKMDNEDFAKLLKKQVNRVRRATNKNRPLYATHGFASKIKHRVIDTSGDYVDKRLLATIGKDPIMGKLFVTKPTVIIQLIENLSAHFLSDKSDIKARYFLFNSVAVAGSAKLKQKTMMFSLPVLCGLPFSEATELIKHEIAHLIAYYKYDFKYYADTDAAHGKIFQHIVKSMGGSGEKKLEIGAKEMAKFSIIVKKVNEIKGSANG